MGKFAQIRKFDVANGPGIRTTVFLSGCTHKCPYCFNEAYQNFSYGAEWTNEKTVELIENLKDDNVRGLTILGGEPLQNLWFIDIIKEIKSKTNKSIWVYSGYTFEEILQDNNKLEFIKLCDILVDGRFDQSKKDLTLIFRGSSNQRIIDIQQTLKLNKIVEASI